MSCIVALLEFSLEIGRKELYLRYLYKLHQLQLNGGYLAEAGFTLKLHARLLDWSDEPCPPVLRSQLQQQTPALSHWAVKEGLHIQMLDYFEKAQLWEFGLELSDELR